ncbi:alpha/beta hydrolase [Candidatus Saccharibacteria bacterium]|nr:alpha/beta hydrolase [Candidatus Saccharibacteria bacterium]
MSKKPPLLLIHGLRGNHQGLSQLAKLLEKSGYEVYSPDLPPAGGQELKSYTAYNYAKFVADYILRLKLDHPVLIGHSLGSIIAAATAKHFPELINNHLILLSPISNKPAKFFAALTPLTSVLPNKTIGYITTKYMFIPESGADLKQVLSTTYLCGADYTSKKSVYAAAKFSAGHSIADYLPDKSRFKITMISGENDRLIPQKETDALAHRLGAKTIYLENSGHLINYEQPAALGKAILAALEQ